MKHSITATEIKWAYIMIIVNVALAFFAYTVRAEGVDYSCTTDQDCECKVVPYEAPNNSPACKDYRAESVQVADQQ